MRSRLSVSQLPVFYLTSGWLPCLPSSPRRSGSACPRELSNAQNICRFVASTCSSFRPPEIPTFPSSDMGGQQPKVPPHILTSHSLVGSGTATPRHDRSKRGNSKRKQTLLSLLDALNELTNDEEAFAKGELPPAFCIRVRIDISAVLESNLQPNFQDDRDVREWSLASSSVVEILTHA
jgi:hypothetical protein